MADKGLNQQSSNDNRDRREAKLKNQEDKDRLFKLVAKVIRWKSGSFDSLSAQPKTKITKEEWRQYEEHYFAIPTSVNREVVKEKLTKIHALIKAYGGLE